MPTISAPRSWRPTLAAALWPTDHRFTGQKQDGSGLQYFNARYYDPSIGTFISADTIVPSPRDSFGYNRYLYARANPMQFNDPTGHFSEDQLNFLGINKSDVSDGIWRFLLALQPEDNIYIPVLGGKSISVKTKIYGDSDPGGKAKFGLYVVGDGIDMPISAVEWLQGHEESLGYMATIYRNMPSGSTAVWDKGGYTSAMYVPMLGQNGVRIGKNSAYWNSFISAARGEGINYTIGRLPVVGDILSAWNSITGSTFGEPCLGCKEGDFAMSFLYPDPVTGPEGVNVRTMWFRYDPVISGELLVDQTWEYSYGPPMWVTDNTFEYAD